MTVSAREATEAWTVAQLTVAGREERGQGWGFAQLMVAARDDGALAGAGDSHS